MMPTENGPIRKLTLGLSELRAPHSMNHLGHTKHRNEGHVRTPGERKQFVLEESGPGTETRAPSLAETGRPILRISH